MSVNAVSGFLIALPEFQVATHVAIESDLDYLIVGKYGTGSLDTTLHCT